MFKKIKSLFIVEEEGTAIPDEISSKSQNTESSQSAFQNSTESSSTNVSKKGIDKFINLLLKAMDEAGQEGFDYLEFKDSIKSLENINMDEATKYKSALAMAQTMGADGSSLESSANYYLNILAMEKQKIYEAYEQKIKKDKEESVDQIQKVKEELKIKTAQLKKLENDLKMHNAELEKLEKDKTEGEQRANVIKSEFDKAYQLINGQITEDLKNLEKYLK